MPNISLSLSNDRLETMCDQALEPHNSETNISSTWPRSSLEMKTQFALIIWKTPKQFSCTQLEPEKWRKTQLSSLVLHIDFCNSIDQYNDADCLNMQFSQNTILEVKWKIYEIFYDIVICWFGVQETTKKLCVFIFALIFDGETLNKKEKKAANCSSYKSSLC